MTWEENVLRQGTPSRRDRARYDKILVAVDHSEISDRAVLAARDLALLSKGDADVIVMGSRGRSDLAGFILGSTAHKVIHLTDRPVLIVR